MADDNQLAADDGNQLATGIAGFESGGRAGAQNPYFPVARGGPLGPHQFIASTWQQFAQANPQLFAGMTPEQVLAARANPQLSAAGAQWYAGQNAQALKAAGIAPTPAALGIAHALGPAGATGVLSAPDEASLADVFQKTQPGMAKAILAQNPTYQKMTVGDLKAKYAALGGAAPSVVAATAPQPAAPVVPPAQVAAATPPVNALSSLNTQAMSPMQRMMMFKQLAQLFAPQPRQQQASAGPQTGGVDASIPLRVV